jgi:NADH-quinone oxidoreductase subunit L
MLERRFRPLYLLFVNKWFFDELIDLLIVRPVKGLGRFADRVVEQYLVNGIVVGTTSLVREAGVAVRDLQSGLLRSYAALMLFGILALGLYFLVRSI